MVSPFHVGMLGHSTCWRGATQIGCDLRCALEMPLRLTQRPVVAFLRPTNTKVAGRYRKGLQGLLLDVSLAEGQILSTRGTV